MSVSAIHTMEALKKRVATLERQTDYELNPSDGNRTISQSISLLSSQLQVFLSTQPSHALLLQNLKQYHIKQDPTPFDLLDIETKREYVVAKLTEMKELAKLLNQIVALKDFKTMGDVDLSKVDIQRITDLQLKYNYLLVKSIEVCGNYLRLVEKVKKVYGETVEIDKIDSKQEGKEEEETEFEDNLADTSAMSLGHSSVVDLLPRKEQENFFGNAEEVD